MSRLRHSQSQVGARSVYLTCALAVLFAMRSLVPVGFMPNQLALNEGRLQIEICSPDGIVSYAYIDLSDESPPLRSQHSTTMAVPCILCVISAQGLMSGNSADHITTPLLVVAATLLFQHSEPIPLQIAGPPLGPRAPPAVFMG